MKIVGMTIGGAFVSSCEQSNVGVTSWTPITSLPIAVYYLEMVTLLGKAYVIGGDISGCISETSVYMCHLYRNNKHLHNRTCNGTSALWLQPRYVRRYVALIL